MKSSVRVLVFGLLASTVLTGQRAVQAHPLTGPFIGLEGNALYGRMKKSSKAETHPEFTFEDKAQGSFSGGVGGFAGYGFVFDNGFYLGAEMNGDFFFGGENKNTFKIHPAKNISKEKGKQQNNNEKKFQIKLDNEDEGETALHGEQKAKNDQGNDKEESLSAAIVTKPRWGAGAALQLGYAITPQCVLYGSGGVNVQGIKTKLQIGDQNVSDKTKQNSVVMGTVGIGVRYWITPNAFLGVEGEAMFGGKKKWSFEKGESLSKEGDDKDAKKEAKIKDNNKESKNLFSENVEKINKSGELSEKMLRRNFGGRLCIGYKF